MAYNPALYFPQNYQPMYQMPQPMPQAIPQPAAPQSRMVEIVPVDTEAAAETFPVAVGATQMMIAKDDSFIAVKINGVNGQSSYAIYDRRPPAPPAPAFDPAEYVRRDEIETLVSAALAMHGSGSKKGRHEEAEE